MHLPMQRWTKPVMALTLLFCAGPSLAEGECQSPKRPGNGPGVYVDYECTRYEGTFQNGYLFGQGKAAFADGRRYEGQFYSSRSVGRGVLTLPDGTVDEGKFQRGGKLHGWGTRRLPDGATLVGEFREGEPFGALLKVKPDGTQEVVQFSTPERPSATTQPPSQNASAQAPAGDKPKDTVNKAVEEVNKKLRGLRGLIGN